MKWRSMDGAGALTRTILTARARRSISTARSPPSRPPPDRAPSASFAAAAKVRGRVTCCGERGFLYTSNGFDDDLPLLG